jgi:hypothetical protein
VGVVTNKQDDFEMSPTPVALNYAMVFPLLIRVLINYFYIFISFYNYKYQ